MCRIGKHYCTVCKFDYECDEPDFACSTINGDEDAQVCSECWRQFEESWHCDEENTRLGESK